MPLRRRDGRFFGTLCALDPLPAPLSDAHLGLFSLLADLIGFQLEAEELHAERAVALHDAEQTAKLRDRFIGILGHDLRNPLGAITLAAQVLLTRDDIEEATARAVRRIARSAARTEDIVGDLLDFARGRLGGNMPISHAPCDAVAIVRQVIEELEIGYPNRTIELNAPSTIAVKWDAARVAQAMSNLVGNALQHSGADCSVRVSIRAAEPWISIAVHNTGTAIPPDTLRTIFDPFRQGASARDVKEGLGLGLYIAREVVIAHSGTIDVTSSDGVGTTFTVRLPSME